ncbi:hypothetical protein F7734_35585 [Scytonema sp. UIC 10036]|uniref:hypothetical protein n=1 Tax=Scytonema sp. UIC 10036 TaxID=2304196 RepID=UPI0012DA7F2B|nr:hypothetical protein [Scytonema sp. UIC 10036]MUG97368.1 hypothetical protein [Scytonema sp. UIC 10036]
MVSVYQQPYNEAIANQLEAFVTMVSTSNLLEPFDEVNSMLRLTGEGEPEIKLLKGIQWRTQHTQLIFKGAEWTFYTDGRFFFTAPVQTANSSTELFTICGTYSKVGNKFAFEGERRVASSSISLDGTICINGDNIDLNVIYTNSIYQRQIARISQKLAKQLQAVVNAPKIENNPVSLKQKPGSETLTLEEDGVLKINKFQDISIFRVSLEGKTEAGFFGPLPGLLYITQSSSSQKPFAVDLMINPKLLVTNGGIIWNSEGEDPNSHGTKN